MAPMRESEIVEAHHEFEDTTFCSRRREEAENVDARYIRLLMSAATSVGAPLSALRAQFALSQFALSQFAFAREDGPR
jgi:hypothetical protein